MHGRVVLGFDGTEQGPGPGHDVRSPPDLEQALKASAEDAEIVSLAGDPSVQLAHALRSWT